MCLKQEMQVMIPYNKCNLTTSLICKKHILLDLVFIMNYQDEIKHHKKREDILEFSSEGRNLQKWVSGKRNIDLRVVTLCLHYKIESIFG